ncbi:MAG TPA: glycosyltransferase family 39 protein [Elusimicrobiota bacterium]|nr:glycosyltransferase family 39 protein [Elusimicrobiota bacterium]
MRRLDKHTLGGVLIVALAAFFSLHGLDREILWQDESETALVAKTVLARGLPFGTDGKNVFSQNRGADYTKDFLWRWHPWLQFYLCAGSFAVFGVGTFSARLPFALLGVATVALLMLFVRRRWEDPRRALWAGAALTFSVPFLLLAREARYYSAAAFFTLLGLYAYDRLTEKNKSGFLLLFCASFFLFHSHYVLCGALLAALLLHASVFSRDRFPPLLAACLAVSVVNLPAVWLFWGTDRGVGLFNAGRALDFFRYYASETLEHIFPLLLLLFPLLAVVMTGRKPSFSPRDRSSAALLSMVAGVTFVFLAVLSPANYFRYLAALIPLACAGEGWILRFLQDVWGIVPAAALLMGLAVYGGLPPFLYEITHRYKGPMDGIVDYLRKNGRDSDVVAITYEDLPLKFYTRMRVVGGLTGEDLSPALKADWIILRKHTVSDKDEQVKNYLLEKVAWPDYEKITIDFPDIPYENRETPDEHLFHTMTREDRVVIHRRKRTT